jgi:hypothetical protein
MTRPRSRFRRFERWLVGLLMAAIVFVLERVVLRSVRKKESSRDEPTPAVTLGEG